MPEALVVGRFCLVRSEMSAPIDVLKIVSAAPTDSTDVLMPLAMSSWFLAFSKMPSSVDTWSLKPFFSSSICSCCLSL